MTDKAKPARGRPPISGTPGERFMIHLPEWAADKLRTSGAGSISRGVMRLVLNDPEALPTAGPTKASERRSKRLARSRARAQSALDIVNERIAARVKAGKSI
jgi:hypothetical protein